MTLVMPQDLWYVKITQFANLYSLSVVIVTNICPVYCKVVFTLATCRIGRSAASKVFKVLFEC